MNFGNNYLLNSNKNTYHSYNKKNINNFISLINKINNNITKIKEENRKRINEYIENNLFNAFINISLNQDIYFSQDYPEYSIVTNDNITIINNNSDDSKIHCNNIKNISNYELSRNIRKINYQNFKLIDNFILVIDFPNWGGGTSFFLNTILSKYKFNQTFLIARNFNNNVEFNINNEFVLNNLYDVSSSIAFLRENKDKISKIFINHILEHNNLFIEEIIKLNKHITYITHDYYLFTDEFSLFYHEIKPKMQTCKKHQSIINRIDTIVTQNITSCSIIKPELNKKTNIVVTSLPDFRKSNNKVITNNKDIRLLVIGNINKHKGFHLLEYLIDYYKKNSILNVNIYLFGNCIECTLSTHNVFQYKDMREFHILLKTHKPNIILEVGLWNETYSYVLTLAMLTKLPILSLKKPFKSVIENRLQMYNNVHYYNSLYELNNLIIKNKQNFFYTIDSNVYIPKWFDDYFIDNKKLLINKPIKFKHDIQPFFIYFPQFHMLEENNKTFYNGFTDYTNLKLIKENESLYNEHSTFDYPLLDYLSKNNNDVESKEYNLLNKKIIQNQIDVISYYNFSGFAIYYYWFSTNTITKNNIIMNKVIDIFFSNSINIKNRKIFFIWANESWSNNPAFVSENNSDKIENIYTPQNIIKNISNLIQYFKHNNYLKVDNKPVFSIHHPWFMNENELTLFHYILKEYCLENNFSGVHLIVNGIQRTYNKFINYYHNLNYKQCKSSTYDDKIKKTIIDYEKYIEKDITEANDGIHSIVFNFDNYTRLSKPNKLHLSTKCINNTEMNKKIFIKKIINKYKNKNTIKNIDKEIISNQDITQANYIDKILLVNAFNEWGEQMFFEPSENIGYYNLNLLFSCLKNQLD